MYLAYPHLYVLHDLCERFLFSPRTPRLFRFDTYPAPDLPDLLFLRVLRVLCER